MPGEQTEHFSQRVAAAVAAEQAALERERESRRQLIELDRHKTEFISSISHELRTPLTSISGYLELLAEGAAGPLTDAQRQMLAIIDRNSRRLLALLDSLVTLSRLEAGTLSIRFDEVDVGALIERVLAAAAVMISARGLVSEINLDAGIGLVPGDAVELERALHHVVTNAIKFTGPGGRISCRARRLADRVVLTVSDTGVGISPSDQERLFTRFFRSGAAHEQAVQGTGLGLVIVKGIIDGHHGDVSVSSVLGSGTTVTIGLPCSAAGGPGPAMTTRGEAPAAISR